MAFTYVVHLGLVHRLLDGDVVNVLVFQTKEVPYGATNDFYSMQRSDQSITKIAVEPCVKKGTFGRQQEGVERQRNPQRLAIVRKDGQEPKEPHSEVRHHCDVIDLITSY